jgi:L-ribulokinase
MKYSIGIDFGTKSARAVLLEVGSHKIITGSEHVYPHGVIETQLPSGTKLGVDWTIQFGNDYYSVLTTCVKDLIKSSRVNPESIIGIGIDTTSCTMLPLNSQFEPLNEDKEFNDNPHAYVKMWKHHAAQRYANELNRIAEQENMSFLKRYGGKISSEWMIPKIMQIVVEAPEVYDAAKCFAEIGDWLIFKLTGNLVKSNVTVGYKSLWNAVDGYPSEDFFAHLHPKLRNVIADKLPAPVQYIGTSAGNLTESAAQDTGLSRHTAVAVAHTDACVVPAAIGVSKAGQMVMSVGTSICHLLLGNEDKIVPGICGVVQDGTLPGFISYEAGQASVGDIFNWFVQKCISAEFLEEAQEKGIDVHQLLDERAQAIRPGESGLVALDWFNGNRSILVDIDLMGMIVGLTIHTTPEEIYRALIEATAFGTRKIIETFEEYGVPVTEIYACGGIPEKSPLIMQIFADVCNKEIKVSKLPQASAYASAIYGATAAGVSQGGYNTVAEAVSEMANQETTNYSPVELNSKLYDDLFQMYGEMHDYFGITSNVMKKLKEMKKAYEGN